MFSLLDRLYVEPWSGGSEVLVLKALVSCDSASLPGVVWVEVGHLGMVTRSSVSHAMQGFQQ